MAGPTIFPKQDSQLPFLLGMFNSRPVAEFLPVLNPTLHVQLNDVRSLPTPETVDKNLVGKIVDECCALARTDWDNFETSWEFRDQPLLRPGLKGATLEASWRNWEAQSTAAIRRMQELETENNRLFIAAYGLDGELQPEVPEEQITLARAEARRDMAAFLSYAVGCMMGRYGPDHPGLILADAGDSLKEYLAKVKRPLEKLTFAPDEDGIIPVLDGEWFEDDIVARTRDFLRATFGEATLNENIRFIEESLGKDLRKYFRSDFYKNHLQTYKKRPIYWLFRSPKGGFAALVYLHRMTRDTPNLVLNRYLRNYLVKLRARIEHLDHAQAVATTTKEKTAARKESEQLKKNLRECEDWERDVLLPLAQSRPAFDLDDGVKVNYLKLGDALATIPGLAAAEDE
jgi:primosomal protein N''